MKNKVTYQDLENKELEQKYAGYKTVMESLISGNGAILPFIKFNDVCQFLSKKNFIKTEVFDSENLKFIIL